MDKARGIVIIPHAYVKWGDNACKSKGVCNSHIHIAKLLEQYIVRTLVDIHAIIAFLIRGRLERTGGHYHAAERGVIITVIDISGKLCRNVNMHGVSDNKFGVRRVIGFTLKVFGIGSRIKAGGIISNGHQL